MSIILDSTTRSLQFTLGAAVTTAQLPFAASYVDSTNTLFGSNNGTSNNTTAVTLVPAPVTSTQRLLKAINIQNADTASVTLTIIYNDNSTLRNILIVALSVGDNLVYDDGDGWSLIDKNGNIKTITSAIGTPSGNAVPQGRLTLQSGSPVINADQSAKGTVYYDQYVGPFVPNYNGSSDTSLTITSGEVSLVLDATNHLSGKVYDIFTIPNGSAVRLVTGPAWTSSTARSSALDFTTRGYITNASSITHAYNNSVDYGPVAANQATYLGTIYCTANGQTTVNLKPTPAGGGTSNVIGLSNGYNRVPIMTLEADSTTSWSYGTATWRGFDNSSSNRVTFVDGLQQSSWMAILQVLAQSSAASSSLNFGVNLDSTSATPNITGAAVSAVASDNTMAISQETFPPQLGVHYIQAMEYAVSGVSGTISGSPFSILLVQGWY